MAFIQICYRRAELKRSPNPWWTVCQILVWKKENDTDGREMRGKVPLMILNQTQPFPVPRARAAQHSPYMVMVFAWRESLGLWIRTWCWNSFVLTSGKRLGPLLWVFWAVSLSAQWEKRLFFVFLLLTCYDVKYLALLITMLWWCQIQISGCCSAQREVCGSMVMLLWPP